MGMARRYPPPGFVSSSGRSAAVTRPLVILGAPSNIGIRPYDDGVTRGLDRAPAVLREELSERRLRSRDMGDVLPPPYRDYVRTPGRARNEDSVIAYSRALADRIAAATRGDAFVLVLGGDCSIVLGNLLGVRRREKPVGLVYVDAHADFATPQESRTGSVASMCLALAVGRGETPLARLDDEPLVRPDDVVLIGRRDHAEPWYGHAALEATPILDLPHREVVSRGLARTAAVALERLTRPAGGFWIHLDADVFDPAVVPAVDSPVPGGLSLEQAVVLLTPLVRHPRARGLELTIYDPSLDSDRGSAARLAEFLSQILS